MNLNLDQLKIQYENDPDFKRTADMCAEVIGGMLSAISEELKLIDPNAVITNPNLPDDVKKKAIRNALFNRRPDLFTAQEIREQFTPEEIRERGIVLPENDIKAIQPPKELTVLLDKINTTIWADIQFKNGKPRKIKTGKTKDEFVLYSIDFSKLDSEKDLTVARKLEPFDKLVYMAVCALWIEAKRKGLPPIFSLSQIYKVMNGGTARKPTNSQLIEIRDSLRKMRLTETTIDTEREYKDNRIKGKARLIRNDVLLSFRFTAALISDKYAIDAVRMHDEPVLLTYSSDRGQISPIPIELLDTPSFRNTNNNIKLKIYLLERICHINHDAAELAQLNAKRLARKSQTATPNETAKAKRIPPHKIKLETLFEECGMNDRQKRWRGKKDSILLLDNWKEKGFIKGYEIKDDAIIITPQKTPSPPTELL